MNFPVGVMVMMASSYRVNVEGGPPSQENGEVAGFKECRSDEDLHGNEEDKRQLVLLVKTAVDVPIAHVGHRLYDVGYSTVRSSGHGAVNSKIKYNNEII